MTKNIKQDIIKNVVEIEMTKEKFIDAVGLGKYKGKIKSIDASTNNWDDDDKGVAIKVTFEIEDKLKQIDYTKTINEIKQK